MHSFFFFYLILSFLSWLTTSHALWRPELQFDIAFINLDEIRANVPLVVLFFLFDVPLWIFFSFFLLLLREIFVFGNVSNNRRSNFWVLCFIVSRISYAIRNYSFITNEYFIAKTLYAHQSAIVIVIYYYGCT